MTELFDLESLVASRSISFENPTGAPGRGGRAASGLGAGRKGAPARALEPGEDIELADIRGPGTIRHLWMTTLGAPTTLRGAVLRAWWDDQEHPSIESPLGDFFGFAHGTTEAFQSAVHSVGERYALNIWLPMPFVSRARLRLANESPLTMPLFYQIDYTLGDRHPDQVGRLHVAFRRENPTRRRRDFEILPARRGKGRYLGAVIGVRPLAPRWWGEGEIKMYFEGDEELATIVGTGSEDYVGLSFGLQQTPFLYHGASWLERDDPSDTGAVSMYRWHIPDPIYWHDSLRVTIQQIGHTGETPASMDEYLEQLVEREDDWSAAAFWYEGLPSAPLSPLPDAAARLADLPARER